MLFLFLACCSHLLCLANSYPSIRNANPNAPSLLKLLHCHKVELDIPLCTHDTPY